MTHAPRTIGFEYTVAAGPAAAAAVVLNTTGNNLEGTDAEYAPIGPFAHWILTIDPKLNLGLDLSALTSIDLAFSGQARAFA